MIQMNGNASPETKYSTYSYFDDGMNIQETTSETTTLSMSSRSVCLEPYWHTQPKDVVKLFLINNPWKHYEPISTMSHYCDNRAGFFFRDCIVCGDNRFKEGFFISHLASSESPINCDKSECYDAVKKSEFRDKCFEDLFLSVWFRDAKKLKYYSRNTDS
jgi:hypothetical protein